MSSVQVLRSIGSVATLQRTRRMLRHRGGRPLALLIGVVYALVSMIVGQMLVFGPTGFSTVTTIYLRQGSPWWSFPMLVILAPNAVVTLPFFATIAMLLISTGIGIGMAVAVLLAIRLVRLRQQSLTGPTALGSMAGLTPAMIALVTLGACCSTTAAATAGIGVVAQASGTTVDNLLTNSWYLGIFQLSIVWISLVAQERLVAVFSVVFDGEPGPIEDPVDRVGVSHGRQLAAMAFRAALIVGGITWALAMVADWTTVSPLDASAGVQFSWLFQHLIPSGLAVSVALYPTESSDLLVRVFRRPVGGLLRAALFVGGLASVGWLPSVAVRAGIHGWLNELFGVWGLSPAVGAVSLPGVVGAALGFRWGLQLLLVGGFALAVSIDPRRAFSWTGALGHPARRPRPAPETASAAGQRSRAVVVEDA